MVDKPARPAVDVSHLFECPSDASSKDASAFYDAQKALLAARYLKAEKLLATLESRRPEDGIVKTLRALTYLARQRMDLARIYASLGARLIGDQTGERADFVRLFHRSIHGSTPDEKWADLMERSGDKPIVAFARLAVRQHDGSDATRIKRIDEARSRYADFACFTHLMLRQLSNLGLTKALYVQVQKATLRFPATPDFELMRAQSLRQTGRLSEAIDALKRLLVNQADCVEARIQLSDMYAETGDEASRVQQLLLAMSDETRPAAQTEFLNEHASSLAAAGQLKEADKLWRLCVTENEKRSDQGLALICASRALRLHMQIEPTRTPERWFSVAQALLAQPSIDSVVRLPYSIELAYLKGLRAVQKADVKSALRDLEQLRTVAKQFHGRAGSARLQRRLDFELALLKQDEDGAVHLLDVMGDQESIEGQPKVVT